MCGAIAHRFLEMLEQRQAALAADEHADHDPREGHLPAEEQDREVRVPLELAHGGRIAYCATPGHLLPCRPRRLARLLPRSSASASAQTNSSGLALTADGNIGCPWRLAKTCPTLLLFTLQGWFGRVGRIKPAAAHRVHVDLGAHAAL